MKKSLFALFLSFMLSPLLAGPGPIPNVDYMPIDNLSTTNVLMRGFSLATNYFNPGYWYWVDGSGPTMVWQKLGNGITVPAAIASIYFPLYETNLEVSTGFRVNGDLTVSGTVYSSTNILWQTNWVFATEVLSNANAIIWQDGNAYLNSATANGHAGFFGDAGGLTNVTAPSVDPTNDFLLSLYGKTYSGLYVGLSTNKPAGSGLISPNFIVGFNTNGSNDRGVSILGGVQNIIPGSVSRSTIGGGRGNSVSSGDSFLGGGLNNSIASLTSVIGGGEKNQINEYLGVGISRSSFIGGGWSNRIDTTGSDCAYGFGAAGPGLYCVIGGGALNYIDGPVCTIAGGAEQINYSCGGFMGGGDTCLIGPSCFQPVISGGAWNVVSNADRGTIGGGIGNYVAAASGAIGGGSSNIVGGLWATVPGGFGNTATGNGSMAAGYGARATNANSFVWSSNGGEGYSRAPEQFVIDAPGGLIVNGGKGITTNLVLSLVGSNITLVIKDGIITGVQ